MKLREPLAPEQVAAFFDNCAADIDAVYQSLLDALPDGEHRQQLWLLHNEARKGLDARREKSLRGKTGRKSELWLDVVRFAGRFLFDAGAIHYDDARWTVDGKTVTPNALLEGTLMEMDEAGFTPTSEKTVRNLLTEPRNQFLIVMEYRELQAT